MREGGRMSRSNEELAVAFQWGDRDGSAELLAQNQGLLTRWAKTIQEQYGLSDILDDLVQEGSIALLQACAKYDTTRDVKLLSFTGQAIRQAMRNCAASLGTVVSMPISRLRQIRAARYFAVQAPVEWSREQVEEMVANKMGLSPLCDPHIAGARGGFAYIRAAGRAKKDALRVWQPGERL